eukprot:4672862-Pyramimonas_sp.AAC.1
MRDLLLVDLRHNNFTTNYMMTLLDVAENRFSRQIYKLSPPGKLQHTSLYAAIIVVGGSGDGDFDTLLFGRRVEFQDWVRPSPDSSADTPLSSIDHWAGRAHSLHLG